MKNFAETFERAALRKGGKEELLSLLPQIKTSQQILAQGDDRLLSMMSKCIFQAGFSWQVVEKKWPDFEVVFKGFQPQVLQLLSAEDLEKLVKDKRIIRNMQKLITVQRNAQWITEIVEQHGSFASFLNTWPQTDFIGLLKLLKKRGERLGGNTGQRFLRMAGIDGFMLSKDVVLGLQSAGLDINTTVTSMRDFKLVQSTFQQWHEDTNLPYSHLSKILAYSAGDNYDNDFIRKQME